MRSQSFKHNLFTMAKLHISSVLTPQPTSPHMVDNPINPHIRSLSLCSCSFQYKDTQFSLSNRVHRIPSALKNGRVPQELGLSESADCLAMVQHSSEEKGREQLSSSAMAIALAMQRACGCHVEFVQRVEKFPAGVFSCPSAEFRSLCSEQLSLCANIVGEDANLSVYLRPPGSYVTGQLELRQAVIYPAQELAKQDDMLVLVGTFDTQASLHSAEAAVAKQQVEEIPEHDALVLPMFKDLFLVGLLVAERQRMQPGIIWAPEKEVEQSSSAAGIKRVKIEPLQQDTHKMLCSSFSAKQKADTVKIARSLAMAYVMDQRALLLQHTSWQRGIRISSLMEEIYGPLSNIRTLCKMLLPHFKRSEIPHDILEDILVQGEHLKGIVEELQDAFYYTKANLMHFREDNMNKVQKVRPNFSFRQAPVFPDYINDGKSATLPVGCKSEADLELPMPPLALAAPPQSNIRPCNVSKLLTELVSAGDALAHSQQQNLQLKESTHLLQAAIEESALRQALSNLLDSALLRVPRGGWVKVEAMEAPGGGVLVVIDDNGPDMSLMTQVQSLAPFGSELSAEGRIEDNIAWNFVAGITIARQILEHYGSVLRMLSPYLPNALLGAGGTHVEIWLPTVPVEGTTES